MFEKFVNFIGYRLFLFLYIICGAISATFAQQFGLARIKFVLFVGILSLVLYILSALCIFGIYIAVNIFKTKKIPIKNFCTKKNVIGIAVVFFACIITKYILCLPIGLQVTHCGYDGNLQQSTYCYKNYFGIKTIKYVDDDIGLMNDVVGDYSYRSKIYLGLGFYKDKATVYIFGTNAENNITYLEPVCINKFGDLLYQGTCQNNQGELIKNYFDNVNGEFHGW